MRTIQFLVAVFAVFALARADDFYVNSGAGGDDSNPGTSALPFKTLAKGVAALQPNHGDRLLLTGEWQETLRVHLDGVTVLGVGSAVIRNSTPGNNIQLAIDTLGTGISVENIAVRSVPFGLIPTGTAHRYRRLCFRDCIYALYTFRDYQTSLTFSSFSECDFLGNTNVAVYLYSSQHNTYERFTIVDNQWGLQAYSSHDTFRNSIVADNIYGVFGGGFANTVDYNIIRANGNADGAQNYYGGTVPGPHDLQQVDPQFVDAGNLNVSLRRTSPAINAGQDSDGLPMTIGAHEIGTLSGSGPGADVQFSSWTDASGAAVTSPGAQVTLGSDGFLHLASGVTTAAALSPVMDLGDDSSIVTNATFRAVEDVMAPSGSMGVIDADNSTFTREFELRVSATPFGALDPSPPWQKTTSNATQSLPGRHAQLRMTLTKAGK